jgi:hypothetical protein
MLGYQGDTVIDVFNERDAEPRLNFLISVRCLIEFVTRREPKFNTERHFRRRETARVRLVISKPTIQFRGLSLSNERDRSGL